jgi:hypothetical protein
MFEKTSRLAEQVASSVSRREILGSFGRWAATAALGAAGVLTGAGTARAEDKKRNYWCCYYGARTTCATGTGCPPTCCGFSLYDHSGPFYDSGCGVCGKGTRACPC